MSRAISVLGLTLTLALAACDDWRADRLMDTAVELGAQGNWDEALHHYERLWVRFPDSPLVDESRLAAARIYAGPKQQPAAAESLYRTVLGNSRRLEAQEEALLRLATLYREREGDSEEAVAVLEAYVQRFPDAGARPETQLTLAELYLDLGWLSQAVRRAEPLVTHEKIAIQKRALMVTGGARELAGFFAEAMDDYRVVLKLSEPGEHFWVDAKEGIARCLEDSGRRAEALEVLARLKSHHPNPEAAERWHEGLSERYEAMQR